MAYSDLQRSSWAATIARSVGMTVAVLAALLLGVAAASYARAGGGEPNSGVTGPGAAPLVQ